MKDFIPVFSSPNQMEADLVRNQLEQAGIPVSLEADEKNGTYQLLINAADKAQAEEILETPENQIEAPEVSELNEAREDAEKEFRQMKYAAVERRARGASGAYKRMIILFAAGIIVCILYFQRGFLFRLGLALVFLAVVDFFVWRDALKAQRELEKNEQGGVK